MIWWSTLEKLSAEEVSDLAHPDVGEPQLHVVAAVTPLMLATLSGNERLAKFLIKFSEIRTVDGVSRCPTIVHRLLGCAPHALALFTCSAAR